MNASYWIASARGPEYPQLDHDLDVDVAIVGGGIVGLTAAHLLQLEGSSVALIDMDKIAHGATGYTTAKVTAGHGLIYAELEKKRGADTAREYATANEAGLDLVRRIVRDAKIDCDLEEKANYVYSEKADEIQTLQDEAAACRRAGLQADFVTDTSLPYSVVGAVRLPNEVQFHPVKYLNALAEHVAAGGGLIFENTRATGLTEGSHTTVKTDLGPRIRARHVVVANHYPYIDRALLFARVHPKRSYAIAGRIAPDRSIDGMFITSDQPTRSLRTIPDPEGTYLLVGGEGHDVGDPSATAQRYEALESFATERFGMVDAEYRWSTQDGSSVDHVPFVGPYRPATNIYIATAFGKWGLSNGTIGAQLIADLISGRPTPFEKLFDPHRITIKASAQKMASENAKVAKHFLIDRVAHPQSKSLEELEPGEAGVDDALLHPVAAFRDRDGNLHKVSAICTHLGCLVRWNDAEHTWDCPCHGSRFGVDGKVIEGPAVTDLKTLD